MAYCHLVVISFLEVVCTQFCTDLFEVVVEPALDFLSLSSPAPPMFVELAQINALSPGGRHSNLTMIVTVWPGRRLRRLCSCGRTLPTALLLTHPALLLPPLVHTLALPLLPNAMEKHRSRWVSIASYCKHWTWGTKYICVAVVASVVLHVYDHFWFFQDGSLRSLINETESLFKTREQEYQATIGQIEVNKSLGLHLITSCSYC